MIGERKHAIVLLGVHLVLRNALRAMGRAESEVALENPFALCAGGESIRDSAGDDARGSSS